MTKVERLEPVLTTLQPSDHPYLNGAWTPLHEEVDAFDLPVLSGAIPIDIDGVYIRNTENQAHQPLGRHHPFDGDGMLHQISFRNGRADYRNRWVRTNCFQAEQETGRSLWGGLMDGPGVSTRPGFGAHGGLKDSASTDVVVHRGQAVSTFYQCGDAWLMNAETLTFEGSASWTPLDGVSAHCKVDERTGELLFFNYSKHAPHLHYGVVDATGALVHYIPVETPGPRLPHDMAFSENYVILNDFPFFWDAELLKQGLHAVRLHEGLRSRFAVIPRRGGPENVRWFEADPTYVLHFLNAYEEGDEIVLDGYFQDDPQPEPLKDAPPKYARMMAYLDEHSMKPRLHRWRFNLKTGETREQRLDDERTVEFGSINQRFAGRPYRYAFSTTTKPGWFLFNGLVKHDLKTGEVREIRLPEGVYASEAPFAPRIGGKNEDDGYIVTFVTDENTQSSQCLLFDAATFDPEPVARIALPHKISSGTHAVWADRDFIRNHRLG